MIHLKLYGLPRTGTNAIAYNVMKTWPGLVRVWHNNGPEDPTGENYWKHGEIKDVPGVDGYLTCAKDMADWIDSMLMYMDAASNRPYCDPRWLPRIWRDWISDADALYDRTRNTIAIDAPIYRLDLSLIGRVFSLPAPDHYHIEPRRMKRCGDQTPLDEYCEDELW